MNTQPNLQQQQQQQQQQKYQLQLTSQQPEYSAKESSQNRNIETFLNRSNKYSKESLQFLQQKNTLLLQQQQQQQCLTNRLSQAKLSQVRGDALNSEVNKIYEIRTQFNKFEQQQEDRSNENGLIKRMNNLNYNNLMSREDQLVEANHGNEDLDEIQESEKQTVSSKMRTLQSSSKQTFSINRVESKNMIPPSQPQSENINFQPCSAQDLHQGERQSVNAYIFSPKVSSRTLQPYQQQGVNAQMQQHQQRNLQQHLQVHHQTPLKVQSQNIIPFNQQKILQSNQQPLFFNPPQTPDPSGVNNIREKQNRVESNSPSNLKSPVNSKMNTNRTLKGNIRSSQSSASLINTGIGGILPNNIPIQVNQSVQSLGYALNLVNKNLEDLSKYLTQMNPNTLQILDLSSNRFQSIPLELCKIKNLKRLKLENNLIKTLPKEIFQELRLESFSIQNNLISDIPPEICEWKGCLQWLNISKNHINCFQKYFCYLEMLTSLNISSNDFMEIPIEIIFLVNLKEFSIDWFKYCLPPRKSTVQGQEGQSIIKELFILLCNHRNTGSISFLQFTTHFSDKNLVQISSQIKKRKHHKQPLKNKGSSITERQNKENNQIGKKQINNKREEQIRKQQAQLDQLNMIQNQENRFILNISNVNLLNSTTTSFNDSILPKDSEGIQLLPEELKKQKNKLLSINKKNQNLDESILDNSRSLLEFINLKGISPNSQMNLQSQQLNSKRHNRSNSNIQLNHPSGVCKTLINFSSESDISFREEERLHTHNDLSFFQENQGKSTPSALRLRGKKLSKNQGHNLQQINIDENVNFDKTLEEVLEENEERNNQIIFQQLNIKLENPPDTLLSFREQRFMQQPLQENNEDDVQDCILNQRGDEADENILSESLEEQEEKTKSTQFLDIASPKIYTQYNQIDPKNGRNLLHLAIMDEDISALRCLANLNFDLVNEEDFDGQTPLSLSILEEKYYSAKILIFNKADVNVGGGVFGSCLTISIIKMQYYLIRDLIRFGSDVNQQDNDGNSPLHYLFQSFHRNPEESTKIAQMLLDNGADPNIENNDKWCPLHFAVKRGCLEAVELAFQYNRVCLAKKNKRGFMINKAGGIDRITILHIASELNHQKIVQLLLRNNVDIFARKTDSKLAYQLCQKHTLVKKLLLLQQTKQIGQHLAMAKANNNHDEEGDEDDEDYEYKHTTNDDEDITFKIRKNDSFNSLERYKQRSNEKNKKSKQSKNKNQKKGQSQKQREDDDDDDDDFNMVKTNQKRNRDEDDYNYGKDDNNIFTVNNDDDEDDDENMNVDSEYGSSQDEEYVQDENQSANYNSNVGGGDENLIDSADSFPVDMEDEDFNTVPKKIIANQQAKLKSNNTNKNNNNSNNKVILINVSSHPRMIKAGDVQTQKLGVTHQFPLFNSQFVQFKNKNGYQRSTAEQIEHQMNESKQSLDEIEDEDLKGDVPKWFYMNHSQIPYSPNNLQKIQGMNEIISQIIHKNSATSAQNKGNINYNGSLLLPTGIRTPEFQEGRIQLSLQNQLILGQEGMNRSMQFKSSNPLSQQQIIQQQLQEQASKTHTIQACNFFSNLKNYKQVIKSASNINEYQLKILDEGLSLTNRLYFLIQLKLIQFKLIQILSLITRQNIYQLFCRSGIIEDFLKLGDDNLNTLINTSQQFNRNIVLIYLKLVDSPNFDNNSILVQIVNLFGDTCHQLFLIFNEKQINPAQAQKDSPIISLNTLIAAQQDIQQLQSNSATNISSHSLNAPLDNNINNVKSIKNKTQNKKFEEPVQTFAQRMKIDYKNNILKDFLELQQCAKMKRDNFTQKTMITDQDFDRMMPTEEEYEADNGELTKILSNYAHINLRNNPLKEITKQNKVIK